jgi:hypothetical protein
MRSLHAYEGGVDAMLIWIIVAVIPIALLGSALFAPKSEASRRYPTSEVWSETEVEYKARPALIPKPGATLKGHAFHPREAFRAVTRARLGALSARATGGPSTVKQN